MWLKKKKIIKNNNKKITLKIKKLTLIESNDLLMHSKRFTSLPMSIKIHPLLKNICAKASPISEHAPVITTVCNKKIFNQNPSTIKF